MAVLAKKGDATAVSWLRRLMFSFLLVFLFSNEGKAASDNDDFATWLEELRVEARQRGMSQAILDDALNGIAPLPRVIELDRSQPEFNLTFEEYLGKVVSPNRKRVAAEKLREHDRLLTEIAAKYGVQKRFLVTFWGVETSFGRYLGSFIVPQALVTLAYDGRRSAYFATNCSMR